MLAALCNLRKGRLLTEPIGEAVTDDLLVFDLRRVDGAVKRDVHACPRLNLGYGDGRGKIGTGSADRERREWRIDAAPGRAVKVGLLDNRSCGLDEPIR